MRTPLLPLWTMLLPLVVACGQPTNPDQAPADGAPTTSERAPTAPARLPAPEPVEAPAHPTLPAPIATALTTHTAGMPAGRYLRYDLALTFGGAERFRGRITQSPTMNRIRLERAGDKAELRYDGQQVAIVPDTATWDNARFAAFTWPYFFGAPMKLADAGTQWGEMQAYPWVDGRPTPAAKLTFAAGTGDAPDDYYVVFPDSATGRIDGMAYVVTFGKGAAGLEGAEPHAIRYSDYAPVDGVPVARRWDFYDWSPETGLGAALGSADLTNVMWVEPVEEDFATAGGAVVAGPES